MADATLDVVGCGSMVVDLFYRAPRIIHADEKILLDPHRAGGEIEHAAVGGLTLNHLGWARVLGLETGIFGKMGNDRHGAFLRAGMDRLGIEQHLTLDGSASSFATVFVDSLGRRAIYMARGATAELEPKEIRRRHGAFIRRARIVTTEISQLPLATVIAILLYARARSIPTALDVDIPPSDACAMLGTRAELERALKLATILKPAKAAARELARGAGASGAGRDALGMAETIRARYGNRAVVITDGARGCAIASDGDFSPLHRAEAASRAERAGAGSRAVRVRVPAFGVKALDTTGAGDAFLGAMLAGLRWNLPWAAIGRLANAAGAVCAGRLGAFPPGFEVREQIERLYGEPLPSPALHAGRERDGQRPPDYAAEIERFFGVCLAEMTTLRSALDSESISRAVEIIRAAGSRGGRVHFTGVGKPEHVARYAASLLSSIGTPATFLHATETLHGGLGQVQPDDVVVAISNSGRTEEICTTAAAIKEHGAGLIAVTGDPRSELARLADLVIPCPVRQEGGVLGLAPRISVLAEIYVIAGLSVGLEAARGLTLEEFGRWHRAGALGEAARRLARNRALRRL